MVTKWEIILRLVLAVAAGGLIGLEREIHGRAAGFRTQILVCLGSTLVMLISIYGFETAGVSTAPDPARLAAQVVSGIGFLGAGTILREGASIKGLTTAASLWVVAGIGLALGAGFYLGAVVATILAVLTLVNRLEKYLLPHDERSLRLHIADQPGQLAAVATLLGQKRVNIRSMNVDTTDDGECHVEMKVETPHNLRLEVLMQELSALPEVKEISWQ
ncbi:MAG TPA: MgtC/SapB family protein [Firmicutes bacterium]|nr:MgtC/SapB family protein [Bacillota bacterium]